MLEQTALFVVPTLQLVAELLLSLLAGLLTWALGASALALVIAAVLAIRRWQVPLARRILWVLVLLVLVQVAYLVYFALGITESLWASGIYFSANDVLHVGMLAWLAITAWALGSSLEDRPA